MNYGCCNEPFVRFFRYVEPRIIRICFISRDGIARVYGLNDVQAGN